MAQWWTLWRNFGPMVGPSADPYWHWVGWLWAEVEPAEDLAVNVGCDFSVNHKPPHAAWPLGQLCSGRPSPGRIRVEGYSGPPGWHAVYGAAGPGIWHGAPSPTFVGWLWTDRQRAVDLDINATGAIRVIGQGSAYSLGVSGLGVMGLGYGLSPPPRPTGPGGRYFRGRPVMRGMGCVC
jgi:hypothetical protein